MVLDLSLSNKIIETDIWSAALQELDILFCTTNTELIGYPEFGCNFEQYIWMMNPATVDLQRYITEKIAGTVFVSQLQHNININIERDNYEMIYHVLITLYDNNHSVQKEITLGGGK